MIIVFQKFLGTTTKYRQVQNFELGRKNKDFKTGLRFKENVPCTLSNHDFIQILRYWEDIKDVQNKPV